MVYISISFVTVKHRIEMHTDIQMNLANRQANRQAYEKMCIKMMHECKQSNQSTYIEMSEN